MPRTVPHNKKSSKEYDKVPNECPMCHFRIVPQEIASHHYDGGHTSILKIVLACNNCNEIFIADYKNQSVSTDTHQYQQCYPSRFKKIEINELVRSISPNFVLIYNQAAEAESIKLTEICGVGYRKSLEFLIKDYLIHLNPDNEGRIKSQYLKPCIDLIEDEQIRFCAERATWLGNDETHYIRKWENKDLSDLKILIDLTVNWITNKLLMERYEAEMGQGR